MTATEQAMQDLRNAIRSELLAELTEWRATLQAEGEDAYDEQYLDGVDDAIITLGG